MSRKIITFAELAQHNPDLAVEIAFGTIQRELDGYMSSSRIDQKVLGRTLNSFQRLYLSDLRKFESLKRIFVRILDNCGPGGLNTFAKFLPNKIDSIENLERLANVFLLYGEGQLIEVGVIYVTQKDQPGFFEKFFEFFILADVKDRGNLLTLIDLIQPDILFLEIIIAALKHGQKEFALKMVLKAVNLRNLNLLDVELKKEIRKSLFQNENLESLFLIMENKMKIFTAKTRVLH